MYNTNLIMVLLDLLFDAHPTGTPLIGRAARMTRKTNKQCQEIDEHDLEILPARPTGLNKGLRV